MSPHTPVNIFQADTIQWNAWKKMTPAERLDECSRQWIYTYELRKNAKRNLRLAVENCFRSAGK
jgi:hypothetical protein